MARIKKPSKKVIIVLVVFFIAAACALAYKYLIMDDQKLVDEKAKTTSTAKSAQSDFQASSGNKEPAPTNDKPSISVSDTGGATQAQPTTSPLVSRDGAITVYSPSKNALFTSGTSLSGKSSLSKVSYRLIDNVSGVTATGTLNVVGGSFSGKFSFTTNATEGRLDVFQTRPDGVELSVIEIPVRFR